MEGEACSSGPNESQGANPESPPWSRRKTSEEGQQMKEKGEDVYKEAGTKKESCKWKRVVRPPGK